MKPERLITLSVIILCVVAVCVLSLGFCSARNKAKTAEANTTLATGRSAASADVNDIRDAADEKIAAINADVKDAQDAIRSAPDAATRNRAAIVGLCDIDPSSSPECGLLNANPR